MPDEFDEIEELTEAFEWAELTEPDEPDEPREEGLCFNGQTFVQDPNGRLHTVDGFFDRQRAGRREGIAETSLQRMEVGLEAARQEEIAEMTRMAAALNDIPNAVEQVRAAMGPLAVSMGARVAEGPHGAGVVDARILPAFMATSISHYVHEYMERADPPTVDHILNSNIGTGGEAMLARLRKAPVKTGQPRMQLKAPVESPTGRLEAMRGRK